MLAVHTRALTLAMLMCSVFRAGAQIVQQAPKVSTITSGSTLAISIFRGGLTATVHAPTNPGLSPLASAALTWPQYPNASGYRVIRQVTTTLISGLYPYAVVTPTALAGSVTSYTATRLVPGTPLNFRVVALVNGSAVDTTAAVAVTVPAVSTGATLPDASVSQVWPAPTSYGFAIVLKRQCNAGMSGMILTWARNGAASQYRALLEPGNIVKVVTDTTAGVELPNGLLSTNAPYAAYVRPEFAVPDWPATGQTFIQPGVWVYFGTTTLPGFGALCHQ